MVPILKPYGFGLAKGKALRMPEDQIIQRTKTKDKVETRVPLLGGEGGRHHCIWEERYPYLL